MMIQKGGATVTSGTTRHENENLDDDVGGIPRSELYEGLKAVGLNYGKVE